MPVRPLTPYETRLLQQNNALLLCCAFLAFSLVLLAAVGVRSDEAARVALQEAAECPR